MCNNIIYINLQYIILYHMKNNIKYIMNIIKNTRKNDNIPIKIVIYYLYNINL